MILRTAQFRYPGPNRIDITRGSGKAKQYVVLAPSWNLLDLARSGLWHSKNDEDRDRIWKEYEQRYTEEMRVSYRAHRATWDELLALPEAVLVCYCADVLRCHRGLLAAMLVKLGAEYLGEVKKGDPLWTTHID